MRDKRMDGRSTAPHELLLIRAGHHLWQSRKRSEWSIAALDAALKTVWKAKEEVRVVLRKEWLETLENRNKHLAKVRQPFAKRG